MAEADAPNYVESENNRTRCANCSFGQTGEDFCDLHDFTYRVGWVCASWQPIAKERSSLYGRVSIRETEKTMAEDTKRNRLVAWLAEGIQAFFGGDEIPDEVLQRKIKDVENWDGSPSRWPDTDAYCRDCLIDVNRAAGRSEKAQSHCKLPIREPGDRQGVYVRQAVFAASGNRGITRVERPQDVSQADWDTAVVEAATDLVEAYEEMESTAPETVMSLAEESRSLGARERAMALHRVFDQVYKIVQEMVFPDEADPVSDDSPVDEFERAYRHIVDLYWDRGVLYALVAVNGMLFRVDLSIEDDNVIPGSPVRVMESFVPTPRSRTLTVTRQADGRTRVTMIASTAILNRVGEIDSTLMFDNFIKHAKEEDAYPVITFAHIPGSRLGEADYLARDGFVYLVSYLLDDNEFGRAAGKAIRKEPLYWGASIEFDPIAREFLLVGDGMEIPVFTDGRNPVITILAEEKAAAHYTSNISRGDNDMKDSTFADLVRLMDGDEDLARQFASQVDGVNNAISERGLIARSTSEDASTEDEEANAEETTDGGTETAADAENEGEATEEEGEDETSEEENNEEGDHPIIADESMVQAIVDQMFGDERFATMMAGTETRMAQVDAAVAELAESVRSLTTASNKGLLSLDGRLKGLEADEAEKQRTWKEDLPRKNGAPLVVTYRARSDESREVSPAGLMQQMREGTLDMDAIADESIEKIFGTSD